MIRGNAAVFICLISFGLFGQNQDKVLDFIINPADFQKMEFAYSNTKAGKEYVKYLFHASEVETIIFDIGVESDRELLGTKPAGALFLTPADWTKLADSLRELIISGNREIRLILPIGNQQFRITPVYAIEWLNSHNEKIEFRSTDMEFLLDLNRDVILSSSDAPFKKTGEQGTGPCKSYTLRKYSKLQPNLFKDITWSPKLGVTREVFSENQGAYALLRIKGIPVAEYMANFCTQNLVARAEEPDKGLLRAKGSQPISPAGRFHQVEKGETFFGIAKKYKILPSELMDENPSVDPNKLSIGLTIKIPDEKILPTLPVGTYVLKEGDYLEKIALSFGITQQDIQIWNPEFDKKVVGDLIFVSAPSKEGPNEGFRTKGDNPTKDLKVKSSLNPQLWESTNGTHTVQINETVSMLAEAYGFTETRFRIMNGLGPDEKIQVGMVLITVICPLPNTPNAPGKKIDARELNPGKNAASATPVEHAPEENTPYFDIQNGKMKTLFSEPEVIASETESTNTTRRSSSQREVYIVQQGDTFYSIAKKFNLSESALRELNKIAIGEVVIPRQRIFLN